MSEQGYKVKEAPACPHCKAVMEKFDSRQLDWGTPFLWVCQNNECPFFKKGWEHMMENYGQLVSYRYMVEPEGGQAGALPTFSRQYLDQHGKPENPYLDPDKWDVPEEE